MSTWEINTVKEKPKEKRDPVKGRKGRREEGREEKKVVNAYKDEAGRRA